MSNAIDISGLSCAYGENTVLKDISFSVKSGGLFIIIGPNGSGKTSLLKTISGNLKIDEGAIKIFGRNINDFSRKSLARSIALVPQNVPTDFPFTVKELVLMGRSPYLGILGLPEKEDFEIAEQSLAFTGAEHLSLRKLDQLSGGERQLVFIARAVCQQTGIILLDEPTASLDLSHQINIMDLMEKLVEMKGLTVVMVSHDINLAAMYSDTLLLLKSGNIISIGKPETVLTYKVLEEVYGCKILVDESPLGKVPRLTPVPRKYFDVNNKLIDKR
ncbi:MAG: ABC transporter ATP-binding protein [Desulfobacterium sp.]|nr:ABC transporter ATP-binding protein [Desulfobacterium sp.]MBU3950393.1 ABC transporter ATP-binding protein [Pseudomonadota bacterium]MBU4009476.1 ABC transporter ATP-binding protein [Pseudomonadota bacterium]MBU4036856.1 ABC transporter ATP-binding protein [Pseudomonadota bacterium]